jgi:hypothetical protein
MHILAITIGENLSEWVSNLYLFKIYLFLMMRITGSSLFRKMKALTSDMYDHVISHSDYERSLPPSSIAHWTAKVEAWERDPSQPNPYKFTITSELELFTLQIIFEFFW